MKCIRPRTGSHTTEQARPQLVAIPQPPPPVELPQLASRMIYFANPTPAFNTSHDLTVYGSDISIKTTLVWSFSKTGLRN